MNLCTLEYFVLEYSSGLWVFEENKKVYTIYLKTKSRCNTQITMSILIRLYRGHVYMNRIQARCIWLVILFALAVASAKTLVFGTHSHNNTDDSIDVYLQKRYLYTCSTFSFGVSANCLQITRPNALVKQI